MLLQGTVMGWDCEKRKSLLVIGIRITKPAPSEGSQEELLSCHFAVLKLTAIKTHPKSIFVQIGSEMASRLLWLHQRPSRARGDALGRWEDLGIIDECHVARLRLEDQEVRNAMSRLEYHD